MRKDPTEFRKRFQSWKLGIPAYRAGKPIGEDEDTRSDTTREGYNEHGVPYGAGRGPAGDSPLKILDAVNEKYAAVHNRPGLVIGEPPAVGIGNPGMFNNSFLTKLFGSPSKAVGRQPMFMTDAVRKNTANLKSALMRYEGNAPSKLTKQGKAWVDYNKNNVDLSLFTAMDINKLVKMNRKDLNLRPDQFVKVTKGGPGFADYTFDVMKNGSSIADMEVGLRNGVAVPEMVSSFTKQPGMSRTLYDAAILSGEQLGYNGLLSGELLISAPKTWSVWKHYPTKKLMKLNGVHQNRMMTKNPNKDGKLLKNLEEAKKAAEEGRSFTIENGPVYLLDKESQFVPVKSADVFDASILDANGVFNRNMNSTNIYKAMLPFAIGGGLWGSKEHKNGKDLPRFADGDDLPDNTTTTNYVGYTRPNGNPIKFDETTGDLIDQVTGETGTMLTGTQPIVIKPTHYDAPHSTYDPNLVNEFTSNIPVIGDVQQGFEAIDAFNKGRYGEAALLAGLMAAPGIIENPTKKIGRFFYKRLRKLGINRATAHDLVSNPDGVMDALLNGDDYPLTQKQIDKLTRKYNKLLSRYLDDIKSKSIKYELGLRAKRLADHGVTSPGPYKIWPDRPKTDTFATYVDPSTMDGNPMWNSQMLGLNGELVANRIEVAFPWLDTRKVRRSNFIDMDSSTYPNGNPQFMLYLGHENTHSFEFDSDFAPYLSLSGKPDKRTRYYTSDFTNLYGSKITRREGNPFIGSIDSRNKVNRALAESDALDTPKSVDTDYFDTYGTDVWRSDASEAIADLRGAIVAGWDEADIYKMMLYKHNMPAEKVDQAIKMGYKNGKDIYIKPSHRGRFTALKKRTGHSASWFKAHGTPALKKMATFELNSKKWHKH